MDFLLQSEDTVLWGSSDEGKRIRIAAQQQIYEAVYLAAVTGQGELVLAVIPGTGKCSSIKTVAWKEAGYSVVQSLVFDRTGSWLVAITQTQAVIIPFSSFMKQAHSGVGNWSKTDATPVSLPSLSGEVTASTWWYTATCQDHCLIGTSKGEIAFVDLERQKMVLRTSVTGHITRLQVVPDDRQHITYLLVTCKSSIQWRLLLDVMDLDLQMSLSREEMAEQGYFFYGEKQYVKSILQPQASKEAFTARRIINVPISSTLSYQMAKGCHLMAAVDKRDKSVKIYDSSVEHHPLYEYTLPYWSHHLVYTDRLIYCVAPMGILVLANQLSERCRLDHQVSNPLSDRTTAELETEKFFGEVYRYNLKSDETVLQMCSHKCPSSWYRSLSDISRESRCRSRQHTLLDGCLIITTHRVIVIKPHISPEQLFLDCCIGDLDLSLLDSLARLAHLDVLQLHLQAAEYHLTNGDIDSALLCITQSQCQRLTSMRLLLSHSQWSVIISVGSEMINDEMVSGQDKTDISNIILQAYTNSQLNVKRLDKFRNFLQVNKFYSLDTSIQLLSNAKLYDLLIETSLKRRFAYAVLDHISSIGAGTAITFSKFLGDKEFVTAVHTVNEGSLFYAMLPQQAAIFVLKCSQPRSSYIQELTTFISDLEVETVRSLAQKFHPQSEFISKIKNTDTGSKSWYYGDGFSSYALVHQEPYEDIQERQLQLIRECTDLFIKLILNLHGRTEDHICFKLDDLKSVLKLSDQEEAVDKLVRRSQPLCCSSYMVSCIGKSGVFSWGSLTLLDKLSVEVRVKLSTPSLLSPVTNDPSIRESANVKVYSISCGERHVLVITENGLFSWGSSAYGQCGTGSRETLTSPQSVDLDCVDIVCGRYHSLGVTEDGRLYSWGWGLHGQLGHNSIENEYKPRHVEALADVFIKSVSGGHSHTLALANQGHLYVFGNNSYGQLSLSDREKSISPVRLELISPVSVMAAGYFHNVAVMTDNTISAWGIHPLVMRRKMQTLRASKEKSTQRATSPDKENVVMSLRDMRMLDNRPIPGNIIQVACGLSHSLFLTDDGEVYTWESSSPSDKPHRVEGLSAEAVFITCDNGFSLAQHTNGTVSSWGRNDYGQLGLGLRNMRMMAIPARVKLPEDQLIPSESIMNAYKESALAKSNTKDVDFAPADDTLDTSLLVLGKLVQCDNDFPTHQVLQLSMNHKCNSLTATIHALHGAWPEACFYHLKSKMACIDHTDRYIEVMLSIITFYLEKVLSTENPEDIQHLLYRILQFWSAKKLPTRELEAVFLQYEEVLSPHLCNLLLTPDNTLLPLQFIQQFSAMFYCRLTLCVTKNNSRLPKSRLQDWSKIAANINASLTTESVGMRVSGHELTRLQSESHNGDIELVSFTCGHCFSSKEFDSTLARFEHSTLSKVPISAPFLISKYRGNGLKQLACPDCVHTTITKIMEFNKI